MKPSATTSIHSRDSRAAALAAAERSNRREGLPPSSAFGRQLDRRLIDGEIDYEQAITALAAHYRRGR